MAAASGRAIGASSSSVKVTFVSAFDPPASDANEIMAPVGPTSRNSRSSGLGWVTPRRTTATLTIVSPAPEMVIVDGLGLPKPHRSWMRTSVGDENWVDPVVVVVMKSWKPPPNWPTSVPSPRSSITYRLQVPLGLVPSKFVSETLAGGAGAGAGKPSETVSTLLGRNEPETIGPPSGIVPAASSSSRMLALVMSVPPPTSEMRRVAAPVGPTLMMSTSSGKVWRQPNTPTSMSVMVPVIPLTVIVDGYGSAAPTPVGSLTGMGFGLL